MELLAVYDHIAREYKTSKELSFRKHIETYSLFDMAGDIRAMRVLDLACGEGFYTRKLKMAGAAITIGVDISREMIHLAQAAERQHPVGCRYLVHDVATLPDLGAFQLVTAMYLLNYAKTRAELLAFCRAAYDQLEAGGRFIGFNDNPMNDPACYGNYRPYGFIKACDDERREGAPIHYTFFNPDGSVFRFDNYYLSPQTYEEVFAEAGFADFRWIKPALAPSQQGNPYWDAFMDEPPVMGFSARKK